MLPPRRDEPDNDEEEQRYASDQEDVGDNADEEDEDDDEEPRLKYTRLTKSLGGVYRNGDAVSTTLVFGERMVWESLHFFGNCGTDVPAEARYLELTTEISSVFPFPPPDSLCSPPTEDLRLIVL